MTGDGCATGSALREFPAHGHSARQALERAARGGFCDVLAPERLTVTVLPEKFLAVADPQNAVILRPQHGIRMIFTESRDSILNSRNTAV